MYSIIGSTAGLHAARPSGLQETPIAITALTAEALAQRGVTNLNDASRFAPGVDIARGGNGGGSFTSQVHIRGVGQDDFIVTSDPGVGTYVDGVYLPRVLLVALSICSTWSASKFCVVPRVTCTSSTRVQASVWSTIGLNLPYSAEI